ncbi:MAG: hypothetical protein BECKG1743D_GA0114223_103267 [Candidatus Kentron sp. G]|nr:MAG: hypothetical protein BECKG1743E_GA0114224_103846 [Candidatus Kentron sp. G]VFN01992.1 MAG: hypothetical protein BECKG1743D_GA0114223_103267 [Candidatus Kentron sp. G]VFN04134.1 MAG: hypothetical protein BECKG1743F_GA0114225_108912 [Candidatus Kentron sp. G]
MNNAYKTYAEVDGSGRMVLDGLPFQQGALLEVLIFEQGRQPKGRVDSWQALMRHVRSLPQSENISEEDIAREIDEVRNAR